MTTQKTPRDQWPVVAPVLAAPPPPRKVSAEPFAFSDLGAAMGRIGKVRPFLIDGWIDGSPIVVWVAGEKSQKSWFAMYVANCVATGTPLFGEYKVSHGPVVYADSEYGDYEFGRREARICRGLGLRWEDVSPRLHHFAAGGMTLDLENDEARWLVKKCKELRPSLVVLNPWRNFLQGNENDSAETQVAMGLVAQLRDACGAAGVDPHHLNRAGTYSGSRALLGRADLIVEGTDEPEPWYSGRGRNVRRGDAIAKRFTIGVTHDDDHDDTIAATRFSLRFEGESVPRTQLSKSALRVLAELRSAGRPVVKSFFRGPPLKMNAAVVDRALSELQDAALAEVNGGRWSVATGEFFAGLGGVE